MIVKVGEGQMLVVIMVDCESRWWWIVNLGDDGLDVLI
jgi:hypothetical protein